ncbi:L-dopachrome tautomerase-related protein [Candidatus Uabimicrobium sp. HlEnr_7]|uniref:L-dopachrome tautomerase-related protein n=1 Tax=Candidatus Uabimicrobium helgolandensis TaxID=3095367 RepID=UPI003556373C
MKKFIFVLLFIACVAQEKILEEVANSKRQWTGIAVSQSGRTFVNYPRWGARTPISVGELQKNGRVIPFPNKNWNGWTLDLSPRNRFVCVQSVYIDNQNFLWVLDPANPKFSGVIKGGPKLLKIDLSSNEILKIYTFNESIVLKNSYLNDVRVDTINQFAYMTDSGDGAIVVLDLKTGISRRLLDNHASTNAEDVVLEIEGKKWLRGGKAPQVHSDGIALSPNNEYLYYQALTAKSLYRIRTQVLRDQNIAQETIHKNVQVLGKTGAADGLIFDPHGNLYISSLENNAILRLTPGLRVQYLVQHESISWPDSFSISNGQLYFTTAQIHLGSSPTNPYRIFKIPISPELRNKNQIISFIYHWFSLLDNNADLKNFLPLLSQTSLYMQFPDVNLYSVFDFQKWHSLVASQIKKATHNIESVKVEIDRDGNYVVQVKLEWQGTTKDNEEMKFKAEQNFVIVETGEQYPRITRCIVKELKSTTMNNKVKEKISLLKKPTFGGFVTIADAKIIENMAMGNQLDFFWIEAEHTEMSVKDVQNLVRVAENEKTVPIVRIPTNDISHIKKYIGTGAKGIIIPSIKNADDAKKAVDATKYPPIGKRPVGAERGNRYLGKFREYFAEANNVVLTILMIETPEAVENLEQIAQVPGVDLWHVGPFDLSVSMGVVIDSPELKAAIQKIETTARKYNIPLGSYAANLETALQKQKHGYYFFTIPGDMQLLQQGVHNYFKVD